MTEYLFENNAESNLSSEIGTANTTIGVTAGDGALFPSPGSGEGFYILVEEGSDSEWMLCTGRSTDTLTVTRNASPSSFTTSATVDLKMNATILESFFQKGSNRTASADPTGTAANYTGEEILDSTHDIWYKHVTGTTWKAMTPTS